MGVGIEVTGPAAVVTMAWPEHRNALGPPEATAVSAALREAAARPDVVGVVLTGEGAFCAGGNLRGAVSRAEMPPEERRTLVYGAYQGLIRALIDLPVPTVAAVDGPAIGMGFDLALACDSCFVGPDGWLQQGWGRVGLVAATGGELLLRRRAPSALWRLLEDQPRIDGATAEQLGVAESVSGTTARQRAVQRVERLAESSRAALMGYVDLHRQQLRAALDEHLALALQHQLQLLASPDFTARVSRVLK
jgi:enoyl-CoA hydratase/carnithine racemase